MSLQFTLLGWSAKGLRCPDCEVRLCPPNSTTAYPVTLIQMPNGTGKTTTLNLLRATLSGSALDWTPQEVRALRRSGDSTPLGQFIVRLGINGKMLTFELTLNFNEGKGAYRTSYSSSSGIQDGFIPPLGIRKFLNPNFVRLFVFDGELANHLLDAKQTRAREAIEALFQLSLLEDVAKSFQENWESHAKTAKVKTNQWLTRLQNSLKELRKKREEIRQERSNLRLQKSNLKVTIQQAQKEYERALSKDRNIGDRLEVIKNELSSAEKVVDSEVQKAIAQMRNPHHLIPGLAESLMHLKMNLDSLKLPTSTSKEFFEELAEADECVCGRPLDPPTRQAVRDRANQYLGEDEVGVLNSIKSDIADYCGNPNPASYHNQLQQQLTDLGNIVRHRDNLKTELRGIEEERLARGDVELENKKNRLDTLKQELDRCRQRLEEIERSPHSKPSEDTDCLKELDKLINKAEEDVAEATHTLELKRKTDIARNILTQAHQQARESLRKIILEETNQRITELLSRDPVLLEDIQDSLKLRGQGGASVGQTLSVSYAFLATLFNRSDYQLPFIVDSPAGALDLNVRPEVARLIPSLCNQFVAFTISSERQNFADVLHREAEEVQYLTLFRKTARMKSLWKNVPRDRIQESADAAIVTGKDFFDRFDLDTEE